MEGSLSDLFLRGLVIGFSVAAPVGPIGVLCIRQTLAKGRLAGLLSGLGAATADAVYGALAALGLGLVSQFLVDQQELLRLVGGLFLCCLGVRVWHAPVQTEPPSEGEIDHGVGRNRFTGAAGAYFSTFFLTLTNPITILSFAAIFAGLGLAATAPGPLAGAALVSGVFVGSAAWWLLLSGLVGFLRHRLPAVALRSINRMSALIILGFGCLALASLFSLGGSP
jgi:threonine/homoserine/homoserine lactone efflux protein